MPRGGTISANTVHDTRQDGITVYSSNIIVDGNEIYNSASIDGAAYISWNVDDVTVTNNNIHDNWISNNLGSPTNDPLTTYGIRVGKDTLFPTNVLINNNIISRNEGGIFYNFQQGSESLNATKNYWAAPKPNIRKHPYRSGLKTMPGGTDGKVDNETFVNGIEYLIGEKIIDIQAN